MNIESINIDEKFGQFNDQWSPKIIGALNGQLVKLAKLQGDFVWHDHADEDELFMVVKGILYLDFRDGRTTTTKAGEIIIVPKGVEHRPHTGEEEVWVMLFEPAETKHTGEVETEMTVKKLDWI